MSGLKRIAAICALAFGLSIMSGVASPAIADNVQTLAPSQQAHDAAHMDKPAR
ncbi:hypothetical protein GCM10009801_03330 [Streptomyces albiaxialis]|uniref:Secreted protein n=1 Tax=Streptomyces albiaxialis TaxID=329523 RepID=A0ABN2VFU9_9ACTN